MKVRLPAVLSLSREVRARVSVAEGHHSFPLTPEAVVHALDAGEVRLAGVAIDALRVRELTALSIVLAQAGAAEEEEVHVPCQNCDTVFSCRPALLVELGPLFDGELDDPEIDPAFDEGPHALTDSQGEGISWVLLAERTVEELRPVLGRSVDDPEVLVTLGIAALDEVTSPAALARAIAADPDLHDDVEELLALELSPPRLEAAPACPTCHLRAQLPAPRRQVLPWEPPPAVPREVPGFPSEERFEELVVRSFVRWRAAKALSTVELAVVHGPADVDDGGAALLGAYEPPTEGTLTTPPCVKVYTRTFRAMYRDEPYDVLREIDVTIRHELEHHEGFLAGDDPMDDDEREQLGAELRRLVGKKESRRRAGRALLDDARSFAGTWPFWLALFALAFATCALSR